MTSPDDTNTAKPPHEWPPDHDDPTDYNPLNAEPIVGVPAGLLATAIELLDLCDELINRPGSNALDAKVATVIRRYQRADLATLRWFHDGLRITAWRMQELLDNCGIVVDPELRHRAAPHHR
ncbi:MAG TPA: hypothetical protein VFC19_13910 [Candidatus Limnocylindrales bacterium]|nr:hypothetical protein [Candidatus Limnocylindrales bacterium]